VISDPLEVVRHLDRSDDEAKVSRHWLLKRQQLDAEPLHLDLEVVERAISGDHQLRLLGVSRQQ
jgi:hypothetical protein